MTARAWTVGIAAAVMTASVALRATPAPQQAADPQQPRPTFRASTERIVIDVTVVGDKGDPVPDLTSGDFTLTIDGKPRAIVSAELVRTDRAVAADAPAGDRAAGATFTSNEQAAAGGRLVVLAFDLDGIPAGGGRDAAQAAGTFLDALSPADQVSLLSLPSGTNIDFTTDRARVRDALAHIVGRGTTDFPHEHAIGISEAFEIDRGNTFALDRVVARECSGSGGALLQGTTQSSCPPAIRDEARTMVQTARTRGLRAFQEFQALLVALGRVEAPKVVVWISGGLALPFEDLAASTLSGDAAEAHATVFVVHLDSPSTGVEAAQAMRSPARMEDRALALHGLETMAGATRGAVFSSNGTGADAFARIAREMSAYYLLSADAEATDRDGKPHRITVTVAGKGITVRARREFIVNRDGAATDAGGSPEDQVARVLRSPVPASGLPLSVATYNLRAPGADKDKVRVLVASDIGRQESGAVNATLGYTVRTSSGKIVATGVHAARAELSPGAAAGPAHTTVAIDLPSGAYTLKLAVVDGEGRRGSVEHAFDASVKGTGGVEVADLVLAPPISESAPAMRLTAAPSAVGAPLDAYLELYGAVGSARPHVRVEVADSDATTPIAAADAEVSQRGDAGRYVAETTLPLGLLPPGTYVARATVTVGSATAERTRRFSILAPVPADDLFKAELASRIGAFDRSSVLTPALLAPALRTARSLDGRQSGPAAEALATSVASDGVDALSHASAPRDDALLASFLRGLVLYHDAKLEEAAGQFRAAIRRSSDFLPGVFYLGACYAAGGKTREAVAAWQTALIGDDPQPDVYRLIADGYLRMGDADEATSLLEEAAGRWPDDESFRLRGAIARAANGHLDEAMAGLAPSLQGPHPDKDAATLALQLAVARVASAPQPDADAERALRDLVSTLQAAGIAAPPSAQRWLAYLDRRTGR